MYDALHFLPVCNFCAVSSSRHSVGTRTGQTAGAERASRGGPRVADRARAADFTNALRQRAGRLERCPDRKTAPLSYGLPTWERIFANVVTDATGPYQTVARPSPLYDESLCLSHPVILAVVIGVEPPVSGSMETPARDTAADQMSVARSGSVETPARGTAADQRPVSPTKN